MTSLEEKINEIDKKIKRLEDLINKTFNIRLLQKKIDTFNTILKEHLENHKFIISFTRGEPDHIQIPKVNKLLNKQIKKLEKLDDKNDKTRKT